MNKIKRFFKDILEKWKSVLKSFKEYFSDEWDTWLAILFGVGFTFLLFFLPSDCGKKTAKAVDDNEPITTDFSYTYITPPLDFYFTVFGDSSSPRYVPISWRFLIYNTSSISTGSAITSDSVYVLNKDGTQVQQSIVFSSFPSSMLYIPPVGSTAPSTYLSITLTTNHVYPEKISGLMTSYSITHYKSSNTQYACGLSITFNFQNGSKIYNIYNESYMITFTTPQSFPRVYPLTTYLAADSEATKEAYNRGTEKGYENGFASGKSAGYSDGYKVGYQAGRQAPQYSFSEFFAGFGTAFINIWNGILNFEFLGVNIAGLIGCVLVVALVLIVLKIIGKA